MEQYRPMPDTPWLELLQRRDLPFGREDSFKLRRTTLLSRRVLLGVHSQHIGVNDVLEMAAELGMPAVYADTLRSHYVNANMVFFGCEQDGPRQVLKVYLELWEALKHRVRETRDLSPALLNVGVKWDTGNRTHCRADYVCHPMLSTKGALGRMALLYRQVPAPHAGDISAGLLRQAEQWAPKASFLYLEVSEGDSPRRSFDLNLYKSGLLIQDVRPMLEQLGRHFSVPAAELACLLDRIAKQPLGHLSGGCDRHGDEFATIYHEVASLPDGFD